MNGVDKLCRNYLTTLVAGSTCVWFSSVMSGLFVKMADFTGDAGGGDRMYEVHHVHDFGYDEIPWRMQVVGANC
jgi:hypothetical protein